MGSNPGYILFFFLLYLEASYTRKAAREQDFSKLIGLMYAHSAVVALSPIFLLVHLMIQLIIQLHNWIWTSKKITALCAYIKPINLEKSCSLAALQLTRKPLESKSTRKDNEPNGGWMLFRYRTLFPYKPEPRPTFLRHTQRSRIQKLGLFRGPQKILI